MSSFRVLHYSCLASNRICHFVCSRRSIFWRNDKYRINIWRERERRQYLLLCLHHASCNVRYWGHQTITLRLIVQGNHDDRQPLARRCNLFRYDFVLLCLTAVNWAEGSNESLLSRACWLWINFRQTFVPSGDSEKKFTKERTIVLGFKLFSFVLLISISVTWSWMRKFYSAFCVSCFLHQNLKLIFDCLPFFTASPDKVHMLSICALNLNFFPI